jgi:hypothetical protein
MSVYMRLGFRQTINLDFEIESLPGFWPGQEVWLEELLFQFMASAAGEQLK